MSTKDITDLQVCRAFADWRANMGGPWPYELLAKRTGQVPKVCYRAMERAARRGLVEYGTSLRTGWLTEKGAALLHGGPTFTYLGRRYREAPEGLPPNSCEGCAFHHSHDDCIDGGDLAAATIGGDCMRRGVIYVRVDGENPTAAT